MPKTGSPVDRQEDRWDLEAVYADTAAWEESLAGLDDRIAELTGFRGRLEEGPRVLRECLDLYFASLKELYRASSYASMRFHEDTRSADTAAMEQRANFVSTRFAEATSFIEPEILSLGPQRVAEYVEAEPGLHVYRHRIDDVLRRAEHTRSSAEEEIIAAAGLVTDAPYSIYGMLANADAPWPLVTLSDGTRVRLNQAAYAKHRSASNREDRETVFESFWGVWQAYARSFGAMLYAQIKRDLFYARVRAYPNSLAAALDTDRIPEKVYRTLVEQANAHLDLLHRYFRLRGRMLGLDELRYYDVYPPLVSTSQTFPIRRAKELLLEALLALGPECVEVTARGLEGRWIDVFPRPGKKAGAYMNGHIYDVHPFVLMNYNEDYESVSTLAHEWGHALHSHLANERQHFANAHYPIFLAEIASTFTEALLLAHMRGEAVDDRERLFYLGYGLEQLRGTFFRQAMFAEYELRLHELVEGGQALTGEKLTETYAEIVRRYHGHDEGVVRLADAYMVEWAYIPHFYYSFYVYQYATSLAASSLLVERVLSGEPGAGEAFLDLLRAGGGDYAYELLQAAGVDLAAPEPYEALMRRMASIMDEIEGILADA